MVDSAVAMAAQPRHGRSLKHRERANHLRAQDISEASVIPADERSDRGGKGERSGIQGEKGRRGERHRRRRRRVQGRKVKRRRGRIAPSRIALDGRTDGE